jgi:hypothetical protein
MVDKLTQMEHVPGFSSNLSTTRTVDKVVDKMVDKLTQTNE